MAQSEVYSEGFELPDLVPLLAGGYSTVGTATLTLGSTDVHTLNGTLVGSKSLGIVNSSGADAGLRFPAQTFFVPRWLVGWVHRIGEDSSTKGFKIRFRKGGSLQAYVFIDNQGRIKIIDGGGTQLAISAATYNFSTGAWISISANLTNTGTITVKVNGVSAVTYTGDVQYLATSQWDQFEVLTTGEIDTVISIDDFAWSSNSFGEPREGSEYLLHTNKDYFILSATPSIGADIFPLVDAHIADNTKYGLLAPRIDGPLLGFFSLGYTDSPFSNGDIGWVRVGLFASLTDGPMGYYVGITGNYGDDLFVPPMGAAGYHSWNFDHLEEVEGGGEYPWTIAAVNILTVSQFGDDAATEGKVYGQYALVWFTAVSNQIPKNRQQISKQFVEDILPPMAARGDATEYHFYLIRPILRIYEDLAHFSASQGDIDLACGGILDFLGDQVAEKRGGLTDDEYRKIIRGRRAALFGKSTLPSLWNAWVILTAPTGTNLTMSVLAPASVRLTVDVDVLPSLIYARRAGDVVRDCVAAGCEVDAIFNQTGAARYDAMGIGFDIGKYSLAIA